jgi:hypothetical protein
MLHLEYLADGRVKVVANSSGPDWRTTILAALVAIVEYSQAQPQEGAGFFNTNVVRPLSKEIGDAGLKTAANALNSSSSGGCSDLVLEAEWHRRN